MACVLVTFLENVVFVLDGSCQPQAYVHNHHSPQVYTLLSDVVLDCSWDAMLSLLASLSKHNS